MLGVLGSLLHLSTANYSNYKILTVAVGSSRRSSTKLSPAIAPWCLPEHRTRRCKQGSRTGRKTRCEIENHVPPSSSCTYYALEETTCSKMRSKNGRPKRRVPHLPKGPWLLTRQDGDSTPLLMIVPPPRRLGVMARTLVRFLILSSDSKNLRLEE